MACWLLSIHPARLEALFAGIKTWEYRRRKIRLAPGDIVVFYATAPVSKPLGWAHVRDVKLGTDPRKVVAELSAPESLIALEYLSGATSASALAFAGFQPLHECCLESLGLSRAPQSYCRIEESTFERIRDTNK